MFVTGAIGQYSRLLGHWVVVLLGQRCQLGYVSVSGQLLGQTDPSPIISSMYSCFRPFNDRVRSLGQVNGLKKRRSGRVNGSKPGQVRSPDQRILGYVGSMG